MDGEVNGLTLKQEQKLLGTRTVRTITAPPSSGSVCPTNQNATFTESTESYNQTTVKVFISSLVLNEQIAITLL